MFQSSGENRRGLDIFIAPTHKTRIYRAARTASTASKSKDRLKSWHEISPMTELRHALFDEGVHALCLIVESEIGVEGPPLVKQALAQ